MYAARRRRAWWLSSRWPRPARLPDTATSASIRMSESPSRKSALAVKPMRGATPMPRMRTRVPGSSSSISNRQSKSMAIGRRAPRPTPRAAPRAPRPRRTPPSTPARRRVHRSRGARRSRRRRPGTARPPRRRRVAARALRRARPSNGPRRELPLGIRRARVRPRRKRLRAGRSRIGHWDLRFEHQPSTSERMCRDYPLGPSAHRPSVVVSATRALPAAPPDGAPAVRCRPAARPALRQLKPSARIVVSGSAARTAGSSARSAHASLTARFRSLGLPSGQPTDDLTTS
jgi:hypothetical protein